MTKVKLSTGYELNLDGDLLSLIEAIYQEVALRKELKHSYEDVMKEIDTLMQQMSPAELAQYFKESLFLNTVTFENEMLDAYVKKLSQERS
jgi:enamine deaminase RidA (YjgF/YER057c/UK114 family)